MTVCHGFRDSRAHRISSARQPHCRLGKLALFCCCFALFAQTGCLQHLLSSPIQFIQRSQPLLGTYVTVSAYGTDRRRLNRAISAAFEVIRQVDQRMSIHRPDSELSRVNLNAAQSPVAISRDLFQVLSEAQAISRESEGAFDITIRPLADLWGFIWKEYRLPTATELNRTLPMVNYQSVELNERDQTVHFLEAGISLDLGGIAKGWAVDRAIASLSEAGITNVMVKAGGDLRVMGHPPGDPHWIVQLEDPQKKGNRPVLCLRDAALSTSGDYENFFIINGRRYSHILDPRTGLPVERIAACSVIANTCMQSDAWATACFVFGAERSLARFGHRFPIRFTLAPAKGEDEWEVIRSKAYDDLKTER